ncbi:MAG TPA: glucose-6-phosphate isomerase [Pseudolabrys sp.]|jgi:glucose-6-phosphate isomerase|nr:glucose-6-phosphate isomerase [Pseudolabrys sp.]
MGFTHSIENAREERVGPHGVKADALDAALTRAESALEWLRARYADRGLPLLRLPDAHGDLEIIRDTARALADRATDIVILGTGGSSLGGQTLAQLAGFAVPGVGALRAPPQLHFIDNLDPESFGALLDRLPHATTRFVAISKSGGTAETLMQTIAAIAALTDAGLQTRIPDVFLGISEPANAGKPNGLRNVLGKYRVPFLDHDPGVGGRYSALTNVGLLPAAMAGLDIAAIREGAKLALAPVLAKKPASQIPAAVGAALSVTLAATKGKSINVLMAYCDRLQRFTHWYVQLWAESLGKNGKGTTPLAALGPVDQHSQLQMFIGGPRDKLFTVIAVDGAGRGPRMDAELAKLAGEPGFAGKAIGDLVAAEARATAETLAKNGCPVRTIHVDKLGEEALGELMMHFMLETIVAAHLLGIDAFDQPAVEEGKVLAKKYLTGS